jgi:hypothetical protein
MKIRHRLTATILLIAFATTSALPAAGIPNIKAPAAIKAAAPRVFTPPKVPAVKMPAAPKIPTTAKVPVVKIPTTPKVPVVKTPVVPKVASLPKVPVAVKVTQTPKITAVKTPVAPKLPVAAKTPVVRVTKAPAVAVLTKAPALVKSPVTRLPVATKPSPIATTQSSPPPNRIMTVQGGNGSAEQSDDTSKKNKKTRDYSDITNAYRRQQQSDAAESDKGDPYFKNGAFLRDQFIADELLVADYYNDQLGAKDLLEDAASQDDVPVAVTRGRIKDLVRVDAAAQLTGVNGDSPELAKAKEAIASGKVRDPKDIGRLVQDVANKGVDDAFGAAPPVSVSDLTKRGDALTDAGKFREARDLYDQAADALRNGGRNSAGFRLSVIADVQAGFRPQSDLNRVSTPHGSSPADNMGGSGGDKGSSSPPSGSSSSNDDSDTGSGGRPGRDPDADLGMPRGGRRNSGGNNNTSSDSTTTSTEPTPSEPASSSSSSSSDQSSAVIDFSDVDPNEGENTEGDGYVDAEPADDFYAPDGKRTEDDPPPDSDDDDILTPADSDDDAADASIPATDGEGRRDPKSDPGFMDRVAAFFGIKQAGNPANTDPVRGDGNATFDRSMPIVDQKLGLIGNPGTAGAAGRPSSIPQGTPIQQNPGNIDPDRNDNSTTTGGRKSGPLPPKPGGGV